MQVHQIPLSDSGIYGKLMMDYIEGYPQLRPFYKYVPALDSFPDVVKERSNFPFHREVLCTELTAQHSRYFTEFPVLQQQIELLKQENAFTVTTGHQPCVAGGPLYFLYKIITTIRLAKSLNERYPDQKVVPVFWMGAEDHDLDEINSVFVFGKTVKWGTRQTGATGRMSTEGMDAFVQELETLLGQEPFAGDVLEKLRKAYLGHSNLADATREFVLQLFASEGLLVLDADRPSLKKIFARIAREEVSTQSAFHIVNTTSEKLGEHYKLQVNPREINLFYLDEQLRERIVLDEKGHYEIVHTDLEFTREFLVDLIDHQPERFSPNVILRPLYQEMILPNLAYIGGPGELAYWMQLKDMFEHYQASFPVLVPRNNGLILPSRPLEKFQQLGFDKKDMFRSYDELSKVWLSGQENLQDDITKTTDAVKAAYDQLAAAFAKTDPTLAASVQAEAQKVVNGLDNLSKKGTAALKRKHEVALNQLKTLLDKVNPDDEPQERLVNFLQFYPKMGPEMIQVFLKEMKPLSFEMTVMVD